MTREIMLGLCLLLSACAPVVNVHKMGNEYIQDAHSRNWWGPNWQRVTYCWQLKDGYCPKDDTRTETQSTIAMDAPGQKMAVAAVGNAPLALGLGLGLAYQRRMTQSVTQGLGQNTVFESPYTVIH